MDLNQITIPSKDVNTATEFYLKLGLRLIVDSRPRYVRFELPFGTSTFSIHHVDHPITTRGMSIYFECEDLDARVAALQHQGIRLETTPVDQAWLWREASLLDPDGNHLILFHAGENRKNPPWRVKNS